MAIARQFMGGRMWPYVVAAWGGFALWVSLFPLTMLDIVPLPIAFVLSCVLATGGYVTSHEAMHSNIAPAGHASTAGSTNGSGRSRPSRSCSRSRWRG